MSKLKSISRYQMHAATVAFVLVLWVGLFGIYKLVDTPADAQDMCEVIYPE